MTNSLLLTMGGVLAFGLFAASAHAAPGQFVALDKAPQSNNLLILTHGGHGGGHWGGHGGGHWGGGHWGGARRFAGGWGGGERQFHRGFGGRGFGYGYYGYGYDNGCWWRYGRWACPGYGWYNGYPY